MTNKKQPTYAEIWDTLSKVDVSEYVEEKMNLSYLSWSRAWWLLMEHYPEATYEYHEGRKFDDCLLYTSPSPRDGLLSRMPSSA